MRLTQADVARMSWHQRERAREAMLAHIDARPPRPRQITTEERAALRRTIAAFAEALADDDKATDRAASVKRAATREAA